MPSRADRFEELDKLVEQDRELVHWRDEITEKRRKIAARKATLVQRVMEAERRRDARGYYGKYEPARFRYEGRHPLDHVFGCGFDPLHQTFKTYRLHVEGCRHQACQERAARLADLREYFAA